MITDEQIENLTTQHKGGYPDIIKHLLSLEEFVKVGIAKKTLKIAIKEAREDSGTGGEFASRIQGFCMQLGFPRPDMKSWTYACTAKAWQLKPKEKDAKKDS